jgi:alpha-L-fucosidase
LYAISLAKPNGDVAIKSLGNAAGLSDKPIACVNVLGSDAPLTWRNDDDALVISLPEIKLPDAATAFKITFAQ